MTNWITNVVIRQEGTCIIEADTAEDAMRKAMKTSPKELEQLDIHTQKVDDCEVLDELHEEEGLYLDLSKTFMGDTNGEEK